LSELDRYPAELLDEYDDDGTMVENLADFSAAVVGHKIVSAKKAGQRASRRCELVGQGGL
jgi:hypothetical protein